MPKTKAKAEDNVKEAVESSEPAKSCFVIMPISDQEGYEKGHFDEVYSSIIKPACEKAGFVPHRADETKRTNLIHIEILEELLQADIAICDLSSKNPNVLFELGIRQAFDKPVVLINDEKTPPIFDISILRYIKYSSRLKYLDAKKTQEELRSFLTDTYTEKDTSINSIIRLMSFKPQPAKLKDGVLGEKEMYEMMMNQFARIDRKIDLMEERSLSATNALTRREVLAQYEDLCTQVEMLCSNQNWDKARHALNELIEFVNANARIASIDRSKIKWYGEWIEDGVPF